MKVYVLERGCYDDAHTVGIFSTPEAAMEAHQPEPGALMGSGYGKELMNTPWSYEWAEDERNKEEQLRSWTFGADWEDAASIEEQEVQ